MDKLRKVRDEVAREKGFLDWASLWSFYLSNEKYHLYDNANADATRRYAITVAENALDRAAERALVEVDGEHGRTLHGAFNSEDPRWVARVNKLSIIGTEIELL